MQKQTVERNAAQQMMNSGLIPKQIAELNLANEQQVNVHEIFNALQEAHHAVSQAQVNNLT